MESLTYLSAGGFGPRVHPPLSLRSTTAGVLPALHVLPEGSRTEDLLLLSLQIQYSIYLEVNLATISLLSPEHWVGKWEGRRPSRSASAGSFPGFPVFLCQLRTVTTGELLGAYLWIGG